MTTLCLVGYGKMGKMIHSMAEAEDCRVISIIDPSQPDAYSDIDILSTAKADVCIEFSHPQVVVENILKLVALHKNVVVGTTGWYEHIPRIKEAVESAKTGFLYGANFSIGMNLFGRIIEYATGVFDKFDAYDILAYEMHHRQKADSPSGTAHELADRILKNSSTKTKAVFDKLDRRPSPEELHFASLRGGRVPGTHRILFDSEADTIELSHSLRSRSSLAMGAILAAKWLSGKKGFYTFNEMIDEILC